MWRQSVLIGQCGWTWAAFMRSQSSISFRQPKSLSQYLINTQKTLSLREPHIYNRKSEREKKGNKIPIFLFICLQAAKEGMPSINMKLEMLTLIACDVDTEVFTSDKMQVLQVYLWFKKKKMNARCVHDRSVCVSARGALSLHARGLCDVARRQFIVFLIAGIFLNESAVVHINILLHAHRWRQCSERPRCRAAPPDGLRHPFV